MSFDNCKFLILSWGRAGSVLVTEYLGRRVGSTPFYVKTKPLGLHSVQHSHLLFKQHELSNYISVFCLRKNFEQSIVSNLIATKFGLYHKFASQEYPNFESFQFADWTRLDRLCKLFISWHKHYENKIKNTDFVVFLEDILVTLPKNDNEYQEVYPKKHEIILNYDKILTKINKVKPLLESSLEKFYQHKNQYNLVDYFNQLQ